MRAPWRLDMVPRAIREGFRFARRSPVSTAILVTTLACGVGASIGVFTLINAVLLQSLPVRHPEDLYFIDVRGVGAERGGSSYPLFQRLQASARTFDIAAFQRTQFPVVINGQFERVTGQYASGNLFQLLGVRTAIGRPLQPGDDEIVGKGGPDGPVAVISYQYWAQRFNSRSDVLGQTVRVGDVTATIVGVTDREFFGLQPGRRVDLTLPLSLARPRVLTNSTASFLDLIGRISKDGNLPAGQAELQVALTQWVDDAGITREARRGYFDSVSLVEARRGVDSLRREFSRPLAALMALVVLTLLLTCTNIASVLLAQTIRRQHELSTRLALGASRAAVVLEVVMGTVVIVGMAMIFGMLIGRIAVRLLVYLVIGTDGEFYLGVPVDFRVLTFIVSVALATTVASSAIPAWWITRVPVAQALRQDSRSVQRSAGSFGRGLVVVQLAITLVLVTGAGLMTRSLQRLANVDKGFDAGGVLTMQVTANSRAFDEAQIRQLWLALVDRLSVLPEVRHISLSSLTPLTASHAGAILTVPGFAATSDADLEVTRNEVTEGYFTVMRIPIVAGRLFVMRETADSQRVAVVNQAAARFYFGSARQAIGRSVAFGRAADAPKVEIVGVTHDTAHRSLRTAAPRMVYVPLAQGLEEHYALTLAVRTDGDPRRLQNILRDAVNRFSQQLTVNDVRPLAVQLENSIRRERSLAALSIGFGVIALLLAGVGLYGLMWQTVTVRTGEIGVRMALGATPTHVVGVVLLDVMPLLATGVLIGMAGAFAIGRLIESQLFATTAFDPITIAVALLVLGVGAAAACFVPLRRAARLSPIAAMRTQ